MHTLKTLTLALLLVIFSVTGLRAEEISLEQFEHEFFTALQAKDVEKIGQLFIDNPNTAEQFQQALASDGEDELAGFVGELRQSFVLNHLQEEGEKAYYALDYPTALEKWQTGLEKAREMGNKKAIAVFLGTIGLVYNELAQYEKALNYHQQALTIHREIKDRRGEGADLTNIGMVYQNLGQYQTALGYHRQALTIFREIKDRRGIGNNLTNIGNVYQNLGPYQTALESYQQALTIHREIKDRRGEGADLTNIGVVYQNLGQYQTALDSLQQALIIDREIKDRRGEGADLNNIGNVYQNLGQYQTALDYYQQALKIKREIKDRQGEGKALGNIGSVYQNLGQTALESYQQALTIHREIKDRRGEGADLTNIGVVYQNLGQYQIALDYYQQALKIIREIKDRQGEGFALGNIGVVYKYQCKYQKAKEAFQDTAIILETVASDDLWRAQRGLASIEAKLNQPELAIQHYEQALDNIEKLRAGITEKEHKISFMQDKLFTYDELIALLQSLHPKHPKKGYDRKAIETFERKQGRVFLEEMAQSGARRFSGLSQEIIQQEHSLTEQLAQTQAHLRKQHAQPFDKRDNTQIETLTQQLETLENEQRAFTTRIQKEYPKYYALKYPQPVKLATLQNQVLQKGEMVLVYGVLDSRVEKKTMLWIIGKHHFQMLTLDISEEELQAKVDAFRASPNTLIEKIKRQPHDEIPDEAKKDLPSLRQASYELYQVLIPEKAKTLLKDARTLYIVPTGPLYGLPFGALDTHNPEQHDTPHYLIQDYPIAYLSSASLLKTLRDTKHDETSKRYPFLAFADPQYPENCSSKTAEATQVIQSLRTQSYLKLAGGEKEGCFKELPETKAQAEEIAKQLNAPKDSQALQLREKASRSNVFDFSDNKRLDDYQYVLFAAHAVLPKEISYIKQSAIVLSNPDTEGYLTMADAFALDMNADLVMLSACNTGRGKKTKGEGIRGLTRAFMYAGTPAVSVSLWKVESQSAKRLSISLFKYLQAGKPLAQALRQSQLDLMADEDLEKYQHPYFWAPFVVFGDGN